MTSSTSRPQVVVVGGGFGGLTAAKHLANAPVGVTVVDRSNHHLFQPLLYQVATAGLSPGEIAVPIRSVLRHAPNVRVLLGDVDRVDLSARRVVFQDGDELTYDFVVIAAGTKTNYFGHHDWARTALGLKDVDDALEVRRRVLLCYEAAERETDEARRRALSTFVVIGGGPTGVELAGSFAELSRFVLARDFRTVRPESTRIILVEAGPRLLPAFAPELSERARVDLERMGVEIRLRTPVTKIDDTGVSLDGEHIACGVALWAAGVKPRSIADKLGAALDDKGRVLVGNDCSIPGHPEAFAIGDIACFQPDGGGPPLPGLAPVAIQQGRFVARAIVRSIEGSARDRFVYVDKGIMATIGRSRAVVQIGRARMTGLFAWVTWLFVHILYLIGFRNRLIVMFEWFWSYVMYRRGARLITGHVLPKLPRHMRATAAPDRRDDRAAPPPAP